MFIGDTLYAKTELLAKRDSASRPNRGIVSVLTTGVNLDSMLVISFERLMLIPARGHAVDDLLDY